MGKLLPNLPNISKILVVERLGGFLGALGLFWASWRGLGGILGGKKNEKLFILELLGHLGWALELLGNVLGPSCSVLGGSWEVLGRFWRFPGTILEAFF